MWGKAWGCSCMPAKQWWGQPNSPLWLLPGHPDAVRLRTLLQLAAGWPAHQQQLQEHKSTGACRVQSAIQHGAQLLVCTRGLPPLCLLEVVAVLCIHMCRL